jgi:DNA-binding NtrC family response regulator
MKDARPTTEVIVVTGYGSVQKAVEATKAGAFFFVEKPFDFEELQLLVDKALERRELVAETANMRRQLSTRAEYYNIIGSSKPMQTIYETIESVAKSDANVLIVGESGTGKELIANAIHYQSLRSKKPFIKVNCAALPKELIESELFGHTWPGNVRELQNVIERAVLLAKDKQIEPIDLPFDTGTVPEGTSANVQWDVPPNMTLEDIERLVIERTLQRTGGNKQAAANLLGIYRPRLYSKIRKYNIDVPSLVSA